jgi:hypothetical protein
MDQISRNIEDRKMEEQDVFNMQLVAVDRQVYRHHVLANMNIPMNNVTSPFRLP